MIQGGRGVSYDDGTRTIELVWTFFDDGELLATGDVNPYFTELFTHDPAAVAAYEQRLTDLQADGFTIATIDQYVDAVSPIVTPSPAPPLLDGTWQPNSTNGVSRWLGRQGVWPGQERDNHVRTACAQAHTDLVAAESISATAGVDARAALDAAWRMLFLGEVTDASGINPFRGEIQYGMAHVTEAMRIARDVIRTSKDALGVTTVWIDPMAGTAIADGADPFRGEPTDAALTPVIDPGERDFSEAWELVGSGHWRYEVWFSAGPSSRVSVTFGARARG